MIRASTGKNNINIFKSERSVNGLIFTDHDKMLFHLSENNPSLQRYAASEKTQTKLRPKDEATIRQCTHCLISGYAKLLESELSTTPMVQSYADIWDVVFDYFYDIDVDSTPSLIATSLGYLKLTIRYWQDNKDDTNQSGEKALHIACRLGLHQTVHWLIELEADVNDEGNIGETPLITACRYGQHQIVKRLLLEDSIDLNRRRAEDGATALFTASRENHKECVRVLLSKNTINIDLPKTNKRTPLWIASFFGYIEIMELLLNGIQIKSPRSESWRHCADVNQSDSSGFTPMFAAAQNNHHQAVRLLLKRKGDPNKASEKGHSPLYISSLRGHIEVVRVLLNRSEIVIDCPDSRGVSPLWTACQNGHDSIVELLLKCNGCNPYRANIDGCSPLWVAAARGHVECIRYLVDRGADVDRADSLKGATPLFVASQNGNTSAVNVLIDAKADLHKARTEDGSAPLMMAAHNGHHETVQLLLDKNVNAMQLNHEDLSAFACAAMTGHLLIVQMLYHYMESKYESEIIESFVNCGDMQHGWTPLHLAAMQGNIDVVEYLMDTVQVDELKPDFEGKLWRDHLPEEHQLNANNESVGITQESDQNNVGAPSI